MGLYKNNSGTLAPIAGTPTNTINALENETIRNGTVNILRNTLSTKTLQSVTITVATDGTITTSGTSTALIAEPIGKISGISGKYHISGCPSDGSANTFCLQLREGTSTYINAYDVGSGVDYTFDSTKTYYVMLVIRASQNMSGKTFRPMVTPLWYDGGYSSSAMTNRELTNELTKISILYDSNDMILTNSGCMYQLRFKGCNASQYQTGMAAIASYLPTTLHGTLYSILNSIYYFATYDNGTVRIIGTYAQSPTNFLNTEHKLYGSLVWIRDKI